MAAAKSRFVRNLPNCITSLRFIATLGLLFIEPFTPLFYWVYTLAGASDVLDGWLARKLKITSELGAKLDSAADLLFYAIMIIRIFPALWANLPRVIWLGVLLVVVLRLITYIYAAVKYRRFSAMHTYMNKIVGAVVFATPYLARTPAITPYCWTMFGLSLLGTIEEFLLHLRSDEYDADRKTLLGNWGKA